MSSPPDVWPGWAKQGVLWLNRTLTFSVFKDPEREAHKNLWAPFTSRVLRILVEEARSRPVAFVMWGGIARELEKPIVEQRDALGAANVKLVKTGHPQMAATYFAGGNPLAAINAAIGTPPVQWL